MLVFQWCPLLGLPCDVTLSIFHWAGSGGSLPCCLMTTILVISLILFHMQDRMGKHHCLLPSPTLTLQSWFLGSFCVLYQSLFGQRFSGCRMFCKTSLEADQVTVSVQSPFKCSWCFVLLILEVYDRNVHIICSDLGEQTTCKSWQLTNFEYHQKRHFPADYPHFKIGWRESWWHDCGDDHFWQNNRVDLFLQHGKQGAYEGKER